MLNVRNQREVIRSEAMFLSLWYLLGVLLVVITCLNAYFVLRVRHERPEFYESIGRPTPFFFATGGWLTSGRFTNFLLSAEPARTFADDSKLRRISWALAGLHLLVLLSTLGAVASLFFRE